MNAARLYCLVDFHVRYHHDVSYLRDPQGLVGLWTVGTRVSQGIELHFYI